MKLLFIILAMMVQMSTDGRKVFRVNNTVMGYTDRKVSAADQELPPALIDWMQWSGTAEALTTSEDHVDPLLQTLWNQHEPYSDLCPEYEPGKQSATGCVATAMAQVMNYWRYPANSFRWDDMLPDYANLQGQAATASQRSAVAELMLACGTALNTDYGKSSGAETYMVPVALAGYGYNRGARTVYRRHLSYAEWAELLRNELRSGRPVIYRGRSSSTGHCFVLDGFNEEGFFHVNWGWGGKSNGWYRFTMLTPPNLGTGGGNSSDGYNVDQAMLVGIAPATILSTPVEMRLEADSMELYKNSLGNDSVIIRGYANRNSGDTIHGEIGVALYQNGTLLRVLRYGSFTRPANGSFSRTIGNFSIGSLTPGEEYQLLAVWREADGPQDWQVITGINHAPCGRTLYAQSYSTFTHQRINNQGKPVCQKMQVGTLATGHIASLQSCWTADTNEWTGRVALALDNGQDFQFIAYSGMDVAAGRVDTLTLTSTPITVPAGNYTLLAGYYDGNSIRWLPGTQTVAVGSCTTTKRLYPVNGVITLSDTIFSAQSPMLEVDLQMAISQSEPADALFSGTINIGIFSAADTVPVLSPASPVNVVCAKGEQVSLHFEGNIGDYLPDGRYLVCVCRRPTGQSGYTIIVSDSSPRYFTVQHDYTALHTSKAVPATARKVLRDGQLIILVDEREYRIW